MWNSIFLPSTTSLRKDLRPKPPPLVEQFLGGAQGLPTFLSRVGVSDPRRKNVLQFVLYVGGIYTRAFVGAAQSPSAPTNSNTGTAGE